MNRPLDSRSGFTLVELAAALAVVGLMSVAAMSALATIGRSSRQLERHRPQASLEAGLVRLLRDDLVGARRVTVAKDALAIGAHSLLEADTHRRRHLPSTIVYTIVEAGGHRLLVRRQSVAGGRPTTELAAVDVKGFRVYTQRDGEAVAPGTELTGLTHLRLLLERTDGAKQEIEVDLW